MSSTRLFLWAAFAYVALIGVRYLLGARQYLTCALREVKAWPTGPDSLTPGQLRFLAVFDAELVAEGFAHLGFAHFSSVVTHYAAPQTLSVFVNATIPAYAFVRRSGSPEDGRTSVLTLATELPDGTALESVSSHLAKILAPPSTLRTQEFPGLPVSEIVKRHVQAVETERKGGEARAAATLEAGLAYLTSRVREMRLAWRERRWVVPTADPQLDRFTLRGAFTLARYSMQLARGRGAGSPLPVNVEATAGARDLRVEAEVDAVLSVAESPQQAPGTPWPLLILISATALASLVAMSLLWSPPIAAIILGVVAFHEAGHAVAMRLVGYRDVHVFFVPLLGAMTIGNTTTATVRGQISMLLAGPVPGLWLAVALLAIDQAIEPVPLLRDAAIGLLLINALNLLPVTPFDGGRVVELLSRPASIWRVVIHATSILGLIALAVALRDSIVTVLAIFWAVLLPQQWLAYRLRRSVADVVGDRTDQPSVVRAALEVMATARYAKWRSLVRQAHARLIAKQFAVPHATSGDRAFGVVAYITSWVPLVIAVVLWRA